MKYRLQRVVLAVLIGLVLLACWKTFAPDSRNWAAAWKLANNWNGFVLGLVGAWLAIPGGVRADSEGGAQIARAVIVAGFVLAAALGG